MTDHAGGGGEWRGRRAEAPPPPPAAAGGGGGAASAGGRGAVPLGCHAVRAASRGRGHGDAAAPDGAGAAPPVRGGPLRAVPRRRAAAAAGGARASGRTGLPRTASGRARGEQDHLGRRPPLLDGRELPPQLLRLHRRGEHGCARALASSDLAHGRAIYSRVS